jgi:hypothetical protein
MYILADILNESGSNTFSFYGLGSYIFRTRVLGGMMST